MSEDDFWWTVAGLCVLALIFVLICIVILLVLLFW